MLHTQFQQSALRNALCAILLFTNCAFAAEPPASSGMDWWREAKFGLFIHWGVYSVPAGTYDGQRVDGIGEWIMQRARIPLNTYKGYARQFNPTQYDPEAWADLARQAGMKYIVITSKHHDGFALYDSAVTEWDIAGSTPYGKDLLAPLAEAARKRGLKFGLYYSQAQDWTHPGGAKADYEDGEGWDAAHKGSFDEYLSKIAVPQTGEILAKYRPDILWWDTPMLMNTERARPLHDLLAAHPNIITNDRLGGGYAGDVKTPEQYIPSTGLAGDWETCMTLNDTWGYKEYDQNWKSPETLIRNLVDIVSKGGNYLLNIGPTSTGEIPLASIERLQAVGKWMAVNGEAIYGSQASPCPTPPWGRVARQRDRLLLFVFDWPTTKPLHVPVKATIGDCRLLADPKRSFKAVVGEGGIDVQLTGEAPDAICSVVVLEYTGSVEGIVPRVQQADNGSITLMAQDGILRGEHVRVEQIAGQYNLGYWLSASDAVEWPCQLTTTGKYDVSAEVAGPLPSEFMLKLGSQELVARVAATGSFDDFQTVSLGSIELKDVGEQTATVKPSSQSWNAINLRRIVLQPHE